MANRYLTLDGVACVLADGRTLFSELHACFDTRRTGLVGHNGVGKSVLAKILADLWQPSGGRVLGEARVHYLAQEPDRRPNDTVATLAGIGPVLAALARIADGSVDPSDYDAVVARWDMCESLEASLVEHGLGHLRADTPACQLSGGEASRVAFLGALLSEADVLILDEPSNHLDRDARQALIRHIEAWPGGMIVVSHDHELLRHMDRIVELSSLGLRTYGGNYDFYAGQSAQEHADALRELEHHKTTRRREQRALREDRERAERRAARGQRSARDANQAPILLGGQKNRSETTAGRVADRQTAQLALLDARVSKAARRVDARAAPTLRAITGQSTPFRLAMLDGVRLPHLHGPCADIDLLVTAGQRIAVTGPNGSGKSTLLRTLAGTLPPLAGKRHAWVTVAYLDQQLDGIDAASPVLDLMRAANPSMDAAESRTRLSQIGLDAAAVTSPSGRLSGGQRLAAGIALAIYADPPATLLLLDEPGNHLDRASLEALEDMLRGYDGGLVVVSHDEAFLARLGLTDRLMATPEGWKRFAC